MDITAGEGFAGRAAGVLAPAYRLGPGGVLWRTPFRLEACTVVQRTGLVVSLQGRTLAGRFGSSGVVGSESSLRTWNVNTNGRSPNGACSCGW